MPSFFHPVTAVCGFAALGGIMFGMDMANWSTASNRPDFLDIFCRDAGYGDATQCIPDGTKQTPQWAFMVGLLAGVLQIGACLCALVIAPYAAALVNRRTLLAAGCAVSDAGLLTMVLSRSIAAMSAGRFVLGIGIGLVTYSLMIYLSEISPKESRGKNSSYFQLATVIGVVVAALLSVPQQWPWYAAFIAPMVPATVVALGAVFYLPTSPRWLVQHGRLDEAREVMRYLRRGKSNEEVHAELCEIEAALEAEATMQECGWSGLLLPGIWQRVVAAVGLVFFQQFCGINSIVTFGDLFFETAGLAGQRAVVGALLCDAANLLGMLVLLFLIDRLGRRFLLQLSAAVMICGWLGCAALNRAFANDGGGGISESMGWLMVGFVMLFELGFGLGYGAIAWVYPSEIFPFAVKNKGMSVMVFAEYASNFALVVGFPPVQQAVGTEAVAWGFAALCALSMVFVHFWVPETKGLSLEAMDGLFGSEYKQRLLGGSSGGISKAGYSVHATPGDARRMQVGTGTGIGMVTRSSSSASTTAAVAVAVDAAALAAIP